MLLPWLAAVAVATLVPHRGPGTEPALACIICGERGVADALLNVIMFMPLGALLALRGTPLRAAALAAFLLSVLIEGAQLMIPGRDPSLGDVTFNTLGGLAGFTLARVTLYQLRETAVARVVPFALAAGVLAIIGTTGFLLQPAFPESVYYAQWTPNLGHLEWYRGRVRRATLGEIEVRPPRLAHSRRVRALLLAGARLDVHGVAGPPIRRLAPLFSIFDDRQREIWLVGPDRDDLVLSYRVRAAAWRLDQPDLRLRGAFATVRAGDTLHVAAWRDAAGHCLVLNQMRACRVGFTAGRGWGSLLYPGSAPAWVKTMLDVGWLAGLLALVGFAGAARSALIAGGATIAAGLGMLAPLTGLAATPMLEWVGAGVGLALGVAARRLLTKRFAQPSISMR